MAGDVMIYVLLALVCIAVRYTATTHATRLGTEAAERVKLALRSKLYRKMVALGPSYKTRIKTSDVVQSAGEGVEQIQSFFELFLPQLFYAILAPITLFVAIAPINVPAAAVMLVCAPFIIIVTGIVSMTAARASRSTGCATPIWAPRSSTISKALRPLKNFDADERAAIEMDKKAEGFRVMTMRVLQIQLRSLTAMDIVLRRCCGRHRCGVMAIRAYAVLCQWCVRLVANRTGLTSAWCACLRGIRPALSHPVRGGLPAVSYRSAVHCAAVRRILLFPCVSLARSSTWR